MGFKKAALISLLVGLVGTMAIFSILFGTEILTWPYDTSTADEIIVDTIETSENVFETGICNEIVPSGCTYFYNTSATKGFGDIYELGKDSEIGDKIVAGEKMINKPHTGDIFLDGDSYMYIYNMKATENGKWVIDETLNGWGVRRISINKKEPYTKTMLNIINQEPVVCASYAFARAFITPETLTIPATVKDISYMFYHTNPLTINVVFEGTPEKYDGCFKESNGFYITEDGQFCDFNASAIVRISGNCQEKVLNEIVKTSEYENIIILN